MIRNLIAVAVCTLGLVTAAGLVALVVAVYLVIVILLGRPPTHGERALLALSMAAAVVSALLWVPVGPRVRRFAERIIGSR